MSEKTPNKRGDGYDSSGSKSFSDVLLIILEDYPRKFLRLLFTITSFTICLGAILFVFAWLVMRNLPSRAAQFQFGPASILFSQSDSTGDKYLVVVPPQGWTRTAIFVPEGSTFEIETGGKVQIDLSGLTKALEARRNAENRVVEEKRGPHPNPTIPLDFAQEDYFTRDELRDMKPKWRWVGPDGLSDSEMKAGNANPVRRQRSILPNEGYGVLLAAFAPANVDPATDPSVIPELVSGAFRVGSMYKQRVTAKQSGYLYLSVNDVQSKIPEFPDMFTVDNIGAFFAKITVTK